MGDDDRNAWLDERAAERLLDGEPLDPGALPTARERYTAERLALLLDTAARSARPAPDTELPGERAALAAFRAARAERVTGPARNGRAVHNGRPACEPRVPGRSLSEPVVRLAPGAAGATAGRRTPRRLQRLRTAAAVTAAGCVLGGVALAAGTVLRSAPPVPESPPGPGDSPTATASPDPSRADDANEGAASAVGGRAGDRPEGKGNDEPDADGATRGTAPGGGADGGAAPDGGPGGAAAPGGAPPDGGQPAKGKSVQRLCAKFFAVQRGEEKARDEKAYDALVRAAGGEEAVAGYCEKHAAPGDHGEGQTGGNDKAKGRGNDEGEGDGDD